MKKLKLIRYLVLLRQRVLKCSTSTAKNVMKKLKEIGFVKEVKGKGKYTFISDFIYVKMKVAKLNQMFKHDTIVNNLDHLKELR